MCFLTTNSVKWNLWSAAQQAWWCSLHSRLHRWLTKIAPHFDIQITATSPSVQFFELHDVWLCSSGNWSTGPSSTPTNPSSRFMNTLKHKRRSQAAAPTSKSHLLSPPPPLSSHHSGWTDCQRDIESYRVGGSPINSLLLPKYNAAIHSRLKAKSRQTRLQSHKPTVFFGQEHFTCTSLWEAEYLFSTFRKKTII